MLKIEVRSMSAVADKLLLELDKMTKETKDEKTLKEIVDLKIRLQRGSLRGRAKRGPLTYEEKERALIKLFKEKGWSTEGIEEYFYRD